ncbi:MAG: hypothetical protein N2053_06120, partial [Chitinispirillaceae bacterium]|nr:hypothetical protein [Chitinispirillaceae bacterium]
MKTTKISMFLFVVVSIVLVSGFLTCELPQYPAPKTEIGIIVSSSDGSVLMKGGVFYDSLGKEIKIGFNIIHVHRVDSFYFRLMSPNGEMVLEKRYSKIDSSIVIEDTSWSKRNMDWDTLIRLMCPGEYDAYVLAFLDNGTEK